VARLPNPCRSQLLTGGGQAAIEHMFYNSRYGKQSPLLSGAAAEPGYSALLGAADRSRAWTMARTDPGVATHQRRRLGRAGHFCSGSSFSTVRRGLVRRRSVATTRGLAERGDTGGGPPGHKPRLTGMCESRAVSVGTQRYPQTVFSALLPGVREFRTPLVTGALWVACAWILLGAKVADSKSMLAFASAQSRTWLVDGYVSSVEKYCRPSRALGEGSGL
jgi:hypothetical protein